MLMELSIRDFAIIPSLTITFDHGLNVLTGETGAGKSIIMDAVSMLIGGRASSDYVRHGQSKAEIEGLFDIAGHPALPELVKELGIEAEDDHLILRRDISKQGRNICRVNGKLVTLAILREIGGQLVDIHGQHEHQYLLQEEKHLSLLDEYGKEKIMPQWQEYHQLYKHLQLLQKKMNQLMENEQQMAQRIDILRFQLDEIAAAELEPGEDERLEQEKRRRTHAQKLFEGIESSFQALHGEGRAVESLALVMHELESLVTVDEELNPMLDQVRDMYYQLDDMAYRLSDHRDAIEFEPQRLDEIENRLAQVEQLKRKYGTDVQDILAYAAQVEDELDSLEHREQRLDELRLKEQEIMQDLWVEAKNLTDVRIEVAKELMHNIHEELQGLHMGQTEVNIEVVPLTKGKAEQLDLDEGIKYINAKGADKVRFLFAPNPGEPLKPFAKIASGGELSRFMLALKSVFSKMEPTSTLIFDEVDTGVSGRIAGSMAERLYAISREQQILCITHQPLVAALSDAHYHIAKEVQAQKTVTKVKTLSEDEKTSELARMMSGREVTHATESHAHELVARARETKQKVQEELSK